MAVDTKIERVGLVGIGNMGGPMAANLINAGFKVSVFDVVAENSAAFVREHGGEVAESLAALAEQNDVVITMLPKGEIVRAVTMGGAGSNDCLLTGFSSGSTLIDMSSSAATGTRELAAELVGQGVAMLDAPVSGGVPRAITGQLAIMVGGDKQVAERFEPVFAAMGKPIYIGQSGAGHAAKLLNNLVSAAGMAVAAEAVVIGEQFGIEPEILVDVFNASTGKNNATDVKFKQFILNKKFNSGFSLSLMLKDLTLALDLAEQCEVPAELSHACLDVWREAHGSLADGADHTEIASYTDRRNNG